MTKNAAKSGRIAVLGALAYDRIATTERPFGASGPGLNSKVSQSYERFGGCGGNIVHHLAQLQQQTLLLSISGMDDSPYRALITARGPELCGIYRDAEHPCANAFILSDPNGNQFTAFQPGPQVTQQSWNNHLETMHAELAECALLLCAPFAPDLMLATMAFTQKCNPNTLVIWCPGQYVDQMSAQDLRDCSNYWHWLVVNEYEAAYISAQAGDILQQNTIITTRGSAAVTVDLSDGSQKTYPVQVATEVVDPTGCGDAFAAGLVSELIENTEQPLTLLDAAIARGMQRARVCLTHHGGQPTPMSRNVYDQ